MCSFPEEKMGRKIDSEKLERKTYRWTDRKIVNGKPNRADAGGIWRDYTKEVSINTEVG